MAVFKNGLDERIKAELLVHWQKSPQKVVEMMDMIERNQILGNLGTKSMTIKSFIQAIIELQLSIGLHPLVYRTWPFGLRKA